MFQFLADLEQRWYREVQDFKQDPKAENPPFFHDYHLQEVNFFLSLCMSVCSLPT